MRRFDVRAVLNADRDARHAKEREMKFSDSYFESEVREGFFVAGMMKRAWAAQLEILEDVDRICRKHGITYFADWGTLLGAVRHQGFIPWDDDLDICMKRKDYHRFLSIAPKELPENCYLHNIHTDETYSELFTRVLNSKQINFSKDFLEKYHGCPYGMGIDIFVMDYIAPDLDKEKEQLELIRDVMGIVEELDAGMLSQEELHSKIAWVEEGFGIEIDLHASLRQQMLILAEKLYALYQEEEASEITIMQLFMMNEKYRMPKSFYQESIRIPFETASIPVPAAYDAVLDHKYGSYMASVKRGGSHDYPFYRKQEETMVQKIGENPYTYVYEKEALNARTDKGPIRVKKQMRGLLCTLEKQLDELTGGKWDQERMLIMLASCQETAIMLGTTIEEKRGEGTRSVGKLEEYCELIYQVHEAVLKQENPDLERYYHRMKDKMEEVRETVKEETDLRYEVIFFPHMASAWGFMESVYQAAKSDPDCVAYVIPVPYFNKNADQTAKEMQDDSHLFPPDVPITKYDAFDYAGHCPDIMYIQNPYDEYDMAMSVHPFFYSSNLKNYTDNLVYIPPYQTDEIMEQDFRAIENIKYCCAVPGVMHADRVIVQSENMRRIYINILTDFAGEETREIWEEKILGIGSPKTDWDSAVKTVMDLPESWKKIIFKPDCSRKKVIMYVTSDAILQQQKEDALKKIKSVFAALEERWDEIALIWMTDASTEKVPSDDCSRIFLERKKLEDEYKSKAWGIYADRDEAEMAVSICDAYYGDGGHIAQLCVRKNIPVMIQNIASADASALH